MTDLLTTIGEFAATLSGPLWQTAIVVVPLAVLTSLVLRMLPCRPSTRHGAWVGLLAMMLILPFLPAAPSISIGSSSDVTEPDTPDVPDAAVEEVSVDIVEPTHEKPTPSEAAPPTPLKATFRR